MPEALEFSFFRQALLAGLLASIACGIIGSYVVVKRMSSIAGGLSHAAFGGIGIGYCLGFSPLIGAAIFTVFSGMAVGWAYIRQHESLDTTVSVVWALGMAIGIIFIHLTPGYAPELGSYLFGNILLVPQEYLAMLALVDTAILVTVYVLYKYFQAVVFDEEFSGVCGVPVEKLFMLLLVLVSLAIVMLIRVVGAVLLIALLTTPAIIARHWSDNLKTMMIYATAISAICTTSGLFLSYLLSATLNLNLPTGPLIILLAMLGYAISAIAVRVTRS